MANDVLASPATRASSWVEEAVFVAFLLLAFVGLSPFAPPPPAQLGAVAATGAGDVLRQACYLLVLAAVMAAAWRRFGTQAFAPVPVLLAALGVWCLLSAAWSGEPAITVRRAGLAAVLVVCAFLNVEAVGVRRSLVLWRWILLAVLIVNFVGVRFIPAAVHLPGEADPQLVGDWRGLYGHKNIAGAVGAMTALLFAFSPAADRSQKLLDIAVAVAAIVFTVMTHSKSSLGLLAIAALMGVLYRLAWRRELDRAILIVAGAVVAVAAAALVIADRTSVLRLFENPDEFTGRAAIWQAEFAYIRDHPLIGAGFGTFSGTGGLSPLRNYVSGWVIDASQGHSGYLQILVTTGAIGFVLALASLVVQPMLVFWARTGDLALKAMLFALFVFLVLHNLMETDFLEGDGAAWVGYLVMLAMLYKLRREAVP